MSIVITDDEYKQLNWYRATWIDEKHRALNADRENEQLRAELAQLRANVAAQAERIAWLTSDIGESGLAAINRLIAACERGNGIDQHCAPDLSIARDEIVRQAEQLNTAYATAAKIAENNAINGAGNDRRYKVAMDIGRQLRELAANAANAPQQPQAQSQEEQSA